MTAKPASEITQSVRLMIFLAYGVATAGVVTAALATGLPLALGLLPFSVLIGWAQYASL